jgi:dephospho-CoA kinase
VPDNYTSLSDAHLKNVEVATAREIVRLERAIDSKHHDARRVGKRFSKTLDTEELLALYDAAAVAARTLHAIRHEQQRRLRAEIDETYGAVESLPAVD